MTSDKVDPKSDALAKSTLNEPQSKTQTQSQTATSEATVPNSNNVGEGPCPWHVAIMEPLQMLVLDYLGPFTPTSNSGFKYILVGVEYMSRYLIALPTTEAKAITTWYFMVDHLSQYFGWPDEVFTDNGDHFTAHEFAGKLPQIKVKHRIAPVRAP